MPRFNGGHTTRARGNARLNQQENAASRQIGPQFSFCCLSANAPLHRMQRGV